MGQRKEFVEAASMSGANVSALCLEYGISRQTGHKWLRRYRQEGALGLVDQSRRPRSSPMRTSDEVVGEVLRLREKHRSWGALKISQVLSRSMGVDGPSRMTVVRVLRRFDKIKKRRAVRIWIVDNRPRIEVEAPNDLWTVDYKGWWKARNGERCEPLTVRDAKTRYVLALVMVADRSGGTVRRVLLRLFKKHGVPRAILVDNGSPWINIRARGGLTALTVWIRSLGIRVFRTRLGSPQDNGAHERMHRDVAELETAPAASRRAQGAISDRWTLDFNHIRPHEALGGKTPAEVYKVADRREVKVRLPVYPPEWRTYRVNRDGRIHVDGDTIRVGESLAGHLIGLKHEGGVRYRGYFFDIDLGILEIASVDVHSVELEAARSSVRGTPRVNLFDEGVSP